MKLYQSMNIALLTLTAIVTAVRADDAELAEFEEFGAAEPRLFLLNVTQNLIAVNSTILLFGLIALAVLTAAALALYYLFIESQNSSGYGYSSGYGGGHSSGYDSYSQYAR